MNFYTPSENPLLYHGLETGLPYIDKPECTFNLRKKRILNVLTLSGPGGGAQRPG